MSSMIGCNLEFITMVVRVLDIHYDCMHVLTL